MTVITLTTDFGTRDGYPGVMKGVIWGIAPDVQIADLTHEVDPQDILGAALLINRSAPYFPEGSIHLAVVDPGVGTSRRAIAAMFGEQYYVGPDNGIFTLVLDKAEAEGKYIRITNLNRPSYWLPGLSNTFHGRDVFAPVAAHLAAGVTIKQLGTQIEDPVRLELPKPVQVSGGWKGVVIHIDHYGNLSTNLTAGLFAEHLDMQVFINGVLISGLVASFSEKPANTLVALIDSAGALAVCMVNGSAQKALNARVGDQVDLRV